jgi:hypothetical protein
LKRGSIHLGHIHIADDQVAFAGRFDGDVFTVTPLKITL